MPLILILTIKLSCVSLMHRDGDREERGEEGEGLSMREEEEGRGFEEDQDHYRTYSTG